MFMKQSDRQTDVGNNEAVTVNVDMKIFLY